MNGDLIECKACDGDGFQIEMCNCREADCPHEPFLGRVTDKRKGLYSRYWVRRLDGSSGEGEKHEHCTYFVLDWQHDPFAIPAALAYADACESEYPELAKDLRRMAERYRK